MRIIFSRLAAVVLLLALSFAGAPAQTPAPDPHSPRARLDAARNIIGSVEAALKGREPNDAELHRLKQGLDPARDQLREVVAEVSSELDQARAQLEQLGPKPDKDKGTPETAELAAERTQREKAVAELDEQTKIGRTLVVRADQLINEIADRRRAQFARELFTRGQSLFSFDLWRLAVEATPDDVAAIRQMAVDWAGVVLRGIFGAEALLLFAGLAAAAALVLGRAWVMTRLNAWLVVAPGSSRLRLVLGAITQVLAGALPALLGCWLFLQAARLGGFAPGRFAPVLAAFLNGIVFVVFINAMTEALLAPNAPDQRFFGVADRNARILVRMARRAALIVAASKIVEALLQATAAALSTSILVRGVFAISFALAVGRGLHKLRDTTSEEGETPAPQVPVDGARLAPLRLVGWLAVVAIVLSALAGYISLAAFLTDQTVWIFVVSVIATVLVHLIDDAAGELLGKRGQLARLLHASVGLRQRAVEQFGVIASAVLKLLTGIVAVMLVLAPWGVESDDLFSSLKAAFFGFKVGDVTLSLSSLIVAGLILTAGLAATRTFQNWLDGRLLPVTDLDRGLRNSIKTGAGYLGVLAAAALSVSSLGLSLEKLTIVAGALSLGIGFGLQSIVGNFVSGLILLWERPIRVGDLIAAGDGDGVVRRINVRSTEIETVDRSIVIIPNSNLISGVVKNRVRADRTGRVVVTISVPRDSSPDQVRDILLATANAHSEVLKDPGPKVFFKKIGDTNLDFDLVCVVGEIDTTPRVSSDLHFSIHKRLVEEAIGAPEHEVAIKGLTRIEDTLEDIAEAIEGDEDPESAKSRPAGKPSKPGSSKPAPRKTS